jgi:CMP-N,N'-diacetyllegionaminic acid synthase
MNSNYVIVPARGGSKGVSNKNLRVIGGRELVVRSIIHAIELVPKENIILSTDSDDIISEVAKFFGIKRVNTEVNSISKYGPFYLHKRGDELSDDKALITEVLFSIHAKLSLLGLQVLTFCLLQPTSPFRNNKELQQVKKILNENTDSSISLVSVCSVGDHHPARMYRLLPNGELGELGGFEADRASRRQDLPRIYIRDGGYYIIGSSLVQAKLQYNVKPMSLVRENPWSINIDTEHDLLIAQSVKDFEIASDPNSESL